MRTSDVKKLLKASTKSLRVYEKAGLIKARRGDNNYRYYDDDDIVRLNLILSLRQAGYSIAHIKEGLDMLSAQESEDIRNLLVHSLYIQAHELASEMENLDQKSCALYETVSRVLNQDALSSEDTHNHLSDVAQFDRRSKKLLAIHDFDAMAENYVERFLLMDKPYLTSVKRAREELGRICRNRSFSVLDVGCGTGNLWEGWCNKKELVLFDCSLNMLIFAKKRHAEATVVLGDILRPNIKADQFDLVVSTFMFHHIAYENQEKAFKNTVSYLKPGGRLFILDRGFKDADSRRRKTALKQAAGDTDYIYSMETEYYLDFSRAVDYFTYLGHQVQLERWAEDVFAITINMD